MKKERKLPLRKCTACGVMKDRKELVRVVKDAQGQFSLDLTGKKAGRGAYVCPNLDCFAKAQKSKSLERSFKSRVPEEIYLDIKAELEKYFL